MIEKIKITYKCDTGIDVEFEEAITKFIHEKTDVRNYASGYNLQNGFRDIVFDKKEEPKIMKCPDSHCACPVNDKGYSC
jgi:hypothetical protein